MISSRAMYVNGFSEWKTVESSGSERLTRQYIGLKRRGEGGAIGGVQMLYILAFLFLIRQCNRYTCTRII